ncbi:MAG: FKBP-type peptidyl-prolyl cis-trans isomerase [Pseudomonadota bacterium]
MGTMNRLAASAFVLAIAACGQNAEEDDKAAGAEAETTQETQTTDADGAAGETTEETADGEAGEPAVDPAERLAAAKAFLDGNAQQEGVETTDSGLQYRIDSKAEGDCVKPAATDVVGVHYVGTLTSGADFDSSRARGEPAQFPLNGVIKGWSEGVQLMCEGDRFTFFVPPELGYGERGAGAAIGPNEALIFDVELLNVISPERNLEKAQAFLEENGAEEGVEVTESGLQYTVLESGPDDGASPSADNQVTVHYKGTLLDGTEFDSSYSRGQPATFPLNGVIPGWTEGVQLMSVGDKFRFFIPPALAYGERGAGARIGPNEALIFDVELIEVK